MVPVGSPASTLSDVSEIRVGHDFLEESQQPFADHLCAIVGSGVHCWGNAEQRQTGPEPWQSTRAPSAVPGLPHVVQLALGARHSCALSDAGEVWCWGANDRGQAGAGPGHDIVANPTRVAGLAKVTQIAAAILDTCALTTDRDVYCWGENMRGEAGANRVEQPIVWHPTRVDIAQKSSQIAGGYSTLCAARDNGRIVCWGYLTDLLGTAFESSTAGEVPDITDATSVAVGSSHACALRRDRSVWCWGQNDAGQLGTPDVAASDHPVAVALPGPATDLVAAWSSTCARLADRRWFCWGDNKESQIGPRSRRSLSQPTLLDLSRVGR